MGGGGAERQLSYLASALGGLGWDVTVALVSAGPNFARLRESGTDVRQLTARGNHDPLLLWRMMQTLRDVRPDLVHVWLLQMEILGGVAAGLRRLPWVFSERSSELAYPPTWKNWLRVRLAARASAIIANSTGGAAYWARRAHGVPRFVVPNAVPIDEIDRSARAVLTDRGIADTTPVVLFAGRFSAEKNLEVLVDALRTSTAETGAAAILAGDGPARPSVEASIGVNGGGMRVLMPGYVDDIWSWMKRADVFVSIGLFEGRPNTVLEAMACGCPLVVSDVPAHREFLTADMACFVNPGDRAAVASAITDVLINRDAALARAANARRAVEQWAIAPIAREYDHVYRTVLARRSGGSE
jgi:glycosyltransferase involved in cell wall biosynthesis